MKKLRHKFLSTKRLVANYQRKDVLLTAIRYCQQDFHHRPVLHGRLQVNWSTKVDILVSYCHRKWALWQANSIIPLYSDFVSCQHFHSIASWVIH